MGFLGRLKETAAHIKETAASVQAMQGDAASARAEWGDGGTARPEWRSAGNVGSASIGGPAHRVAAAAGAVPEDELARLHERTEDLRDVLAHGAAGIATVHGAQDTGERLARHAIVAFDLTLRPDDGGPERRSTVALPVCGVGLRGHDEQATRPVRFDPADPERLMFVWQGKRRSKLHRGHVKTKGLRGQRIDLVGLLPGRALVEAYSAMLEPGEVSNAVETDLHLSLRVPGETGGPSVACGHLLDWKPIKFLELGMDVPVAVDPVSGELEDLVVAGLTEELRPRFGELSATDQLFVEPIRDVVDGVKDIAATAKDLTTKEFWQFERAPEDGGFAPGDPILEPANGVTFEQWVGVTAGLIADRVPPTDHDAYAQRHGVPAGAWAEGERQWRRRQMGHPMMAERFGRALERAQKRP